MQSFLKKNAFTLLLVAGIILYVVVAGKTRSCATCAFITDAVGLSEPGAPESDVITGSAVNWSVTGLDNAVLSSEELQGKVVIVDFWATWCPPCRKEIPSFIELQETYGDDGLVVVGISVDREGPRVVREFASEYGIQYPLAMADDAVLRAFGGIEALPTTFILNRDGQIVSRKVGYAGKDFFEDAIRKLL